MPILIIINPVSGSKRANKIFNELEPLLALEAKTIITSQKIGHIYEIAFSLELSHFDLLILFGGDGSLNEFINGMMDRPDQCRIPIGLIPAGTGNSLMHDLGLLEPSKALAKIKAGNTRKIDIAKVVFKEGHHYAFNVVGWGLPSTINQKAEKLKFCGSQRYNIASLIEIIRHPKWDLNLELDGKPLNGIYSFFMACNTIHTGKGMKIAPSAQLDDGFFDVIMLKPTSRFKMLSLFTKIFKGEHLKSGIVEHRRIEKITLSEDIPSKLIIDGQVVGSSPFTLEVLQKEIEIFA